MERIENLQLHGLKLIQNTDRFRFGTDGVLLARFAKVKRGDKVLDLGCGCGIVSFVLYGRFPKAVYTGIDLQPEMVEMANRSAAMNGVSDMTFIAQDMKTFDGKNAYDVVVCNPPYERLATGEQTKNPAEALARYELAVTLYDVAICAARALVPQGRLYLIHKAERLTEAARLLHEVGVELKTVRPVQARPDSPPRLLLLGAVKGGKEYLHWQPPVILSDLAQHKISYEEL